jgi:hypothetical protein
MFVWLGFMSGDKDSQSSIKRTSGKATYDDLIKEFSSFSFFQADWQIFGIHG